MHTMIHGSIDTYIYAYKETDCKHTYTYAYININAYMYVIFVYANHLILSYTVCTYASNSTPKPTHCAESCSGAVTVSGSSFVCA